MVELFVGLRRLPGLVNAPLRHFHIRHDELQIDDVHIPDRVGGALHVDDIFVVKAPHHMDDGGALPDVGQKLVSQPLALGRPLHQARNVHKLHHRGGGLLRLIEVAEPVQAAVRHGYGAHIGVNGAEGIIGALRACVGDGVEQGGLAHIGQANDA